MNAETKKNLVAVYLLVALWLLAMIGIAKSANADQPVDDEAGYCILFSEFGAYGTNQSSADEWYELISVCETEVIVEGWVIETTQSDGDVVTSTIPTVTMTPGGVALFERTDDTTIPEVEADGIHGTGMSLVGILVNSGIDEIAIYNPANPTVEYHRLVFANGEWPGGSSSPASSVQWYNGQWETTNWSPNSAVTNGSPGEHNVGNLESPPTCEEFFNTGQYDYELVMATTPDTDGMLFNPQFRLYVTVQSVTDGVVTNVETTHVWDYESVGYPYTGWTYTGSLYSPNDAPITESCLHQMALLVGVANNWLIDREFDDNLLNAGQVERLLNYLDAVTDNINPKIETVFMPSIVKVK